MSVAPALISEPDKRAIRSGMHPWVLFGLWRLWRLLVSVFVLVTATFFMVHLIPGDPVRAILGPTAPEEIVQATRDNLRVDEPLLQQYWQYVTGLVRGNLGVSLDGEIPVTQVIDDRLPATLQFASLSFVVNFAVGVPLGVVMARLTRGGRRPRTETSFNSIGIVISTIPEFLLGILLVYVLGVSLGWLPVAGQSGPDSFIAPIAALSIGLVFLVARLIRLDMLRVLNLDFIKAARAKRMSQFRIYLRHALPNSLASTLTIAGLALGSMQAGTVLVETVFAWPGLGTTLVTSVVNKNVPVVQGVVLVYGIMILLLNLLVDVCIALVDPRITSARGAR